MESEIVLERDIKTMSNYLKSQLKKDLHEVMEPIGSSLRGIYFIIEDLRDDVETYLEFLGESQQM